MGVEAAPVRSRGPAAAIFVGSLGSAKSRAVINIGVLESLYRVDWSRNARRPGRTSGSQELGIRASRRRVWQILTEGIAGWCLARFYVGKSPVRFILEPQVGGRAFEDWGDGEGALWARVSTVRREELLQWAADIPIDYGGPARSITSFMREEDGDDTLLEFRDTISGEFCEEMGVHLEQGWGFLLRECLKPFIEEGKRRERPESVVRAGGDEVRASPTRDQ